jgi:hypothetical protein
MVDPFRPNDYKGWEHQEWQRLHEQLKKPPPPAPSGGSAWGGSSSPVDSSGSSAGASDFSSPGGGGGGPGVAAGIVGGVAKVGSALGEQSFKSAHGLVNRVSPLRGLVKVGERIAGAGTIVKLICAIPCALIAAGVAAGYGEAGILVWLALGGGAIVGWYLPSIVGMLIVLGVHLTALALIVAAIAALVVLAYVLIKAAAS